MEEMAFVVKNSNIQIKELVLGPYETNAYILICSKTRDSVLIDAPAEANTIIDRMKGTNPKYILLTHNHFDHIEALFDLHSKLNVPLAAHPADTRYLPFAPEVLLSDGDTVSFGNIKLEVLHTPGHTPGSLCFRAGKYLMVGDTIFPGGPGKTTSATSFRQIVKSLTEKILVLPENTRIYPGHGDSTILKKEKREFAVFSSRPHNPKLHGDVVWLSS